MGKKLALSLLMAFVGVTASCGDECDPKEYRCAVVDGMKAYQSCTGADYTWQTQEICPVDYICKVGEGCIKPD